MSAVTGTDTFIFHSDVGPVVAQVRTVFRFDVEDIIHNRAVGLGRKLQFYRLGQKASPNDVRAERTIGSAYTNTAEVLPG